MGKQSKRTSKVASVLIGVSGLVVLSTTAVVKPIQRNEAFEGPELGAAEFLAFETHSRERLRSPVISALVPVEREGASIDMGAVESETEAPETPPLPVIVD